MKYNASSQWKINDGKKIEVVWEFETVKLLYIRKHIYFLWDNHQKHISVWLKNTKVFGWPSDYRVGNLSLKDARINIPGPNVTDKKLLP